MSNALLTENLLRRELQVIIAGLASRHFNDLPGYSLTMRGGGSHGYDLTATYLPITGSVHFATVELTLSLGEFAERYLVPLANQLVPQHTALLNRLDVMWSTTIRPALIEFAKQYREES